VARDPGQGNGVTRLLARSLAFVLVIGAAAGCGTVAGAGESSPSAPPGSVAVAAEAIAFDRTTLEVPADRPFSLLFDNREGVPHNVTIIDASGRNVFTGEILSGPASRTYQVPALPTGEYRFRCDVHPGMEGTLTAGG
jgi:plastocyanin